MNVEILIAKSAEKQLSLRELSECRQRLCEILPNEHQTLPFRVGCSSVRVIRSNQRAQHINCNNGPFRISCACVFGNMGVASISPGIS